MITASSPLCHIPESVDRRQVLHLEAIVLSLRLIERDYSEVERQLAGKEPGFAEAPVVIGAAWGIVDACHRLRLLVAGLPGLKHDASFEIFMRGTMQVEDFRHGLQHLDERIKTLAEENSPVWGSLTWLEAVSETQIGSRVFIPGSIAAGMSVEVINPIGKEIHGAFDHLHLNAFGQSLSLSGLWRACRQFSERLEDAAAVTFSGLEGDEIQQVRFALHHS